MPYKIRVTKINRMTIQQAQTDVDQWIKTVGVRYFNELTNLGILMGSWGTVPLNGEEIW